MPGPEELSVLHNAILAYCHLSFRQDMKSLTLGLLPEKLRRRFVPPEQDPWDAPEEVGRQFAGFIGLTGEREQVLIMSFAARVHQAKTAAIKAGFFLRSKPTRSLAKPDYPSDVNQLIGLGERLASNFTLPDLTPERAQFLLARAVIEVSQLANEE